MFLIILQGALIVLRIFLSINVAALNVGRSLAKKASEATDEVAENLDEKDSAASTVGSVAAKGGSTTLKVVDATATGARTVLKVIIGLLDAVIAVSLLATILVIIVAALGIVLLAFVSSFVSMNFYENCETPSKDDKGFSEVKGDKEKKDEKKKQKECTTIGSSTTKKDAEKGKEEKTTGDASNSDEVNKMIAYFKDAQGKVTQDCTDAVQNALDAAGLFTSRQKGGYDMGPQHSDWADRVESYKSMGALPHDQWQAGDIISVPGHVYMYLGGNEYGHGGWGGNDQTVIVGWEIYSVTGEVARFQGK